MTTAMSKRQLIVLGSLFTIGASLLIGVFVSLRSQAVRNQGQLIKLLAATHATFTRDTPKKIQNVIFDDRVILIPDHEAVASGYTLRLYSRDTTFTITAHPLNPGKTGVFSFFRDEAGVIRFERELGLPANEHSDPWMH